MVRTLCLSVRLFAIYPKPASPRLGDRDAMADEQVNRGYPGL